MLPVTCSAMTLMCLRSESHTWTFYSFTSMELNLNSAEHHHQASHLGLSRESCGGRVREEPRSGTRESSAWIRLLWLLTVWLIACSLFLDALFFWSATWKLKTTSNYSKLWRLNKNLRWVFLFLAVFNLSYTWVCSLKFDQMCPSLRRLALFHKLVTLDKIHLSGGWDAQI